MPYFNHAWVPSSQLIEVIGATKYFYHMAHGNWPPEVTSKFGFPTDDVPQVLPEGPVTKVAAAQAKKEAPVSANIPLDAREHFLFGCDPELFVFKDGKAVTAEGLIPGTKMDPYQLDSGVAVQVDGMAAEFNIPPVSCFRDWNKYIELAQNELAKMLPPGHELRAIPAVTFDEDAFDAAPDCAKELGCSPDYNAWTGKVNPPPKDPNNPRLRTASGHIHIGWTKGAEIIDPQHVMNCRDLVKQLDWFLGGWSLRVDTDPTRRNLYGKAGAMRFKSYGVEYRVLSNFWITSRDRRLAVWNRLQHAINSIADGFIPDRSPKYNELLQAAINESKMSPELSKTFNYPLVSLQKPETVRGRKSPFVGIIPY